MKFGSAVAWHATSNVSPSYSFWNLRQVPHTAVWQDDPPVATVLGQDL